MIWNACWQSSNLGPIGYSNLGPMNLWKILIVITDPVHHYSIAWYYSRLNRIDFGVISYFFRGLKVHLEQLRHFEYWSYPFLCPKSNFCPNLIYIKWLRKSDIIKFIEERSVPVSKCSYARRNRLNQTQ